MSMPQIDILDEKSRNRTNTTILLQIKDYLSLLLALQDPRAAEKLEDVHNSGRILMPPPILLNSSVEITGPEDQ